jgi:hypothetical protein
VNIIKLTCLVICMFIISCNDKKASKVGEDTVTVVEDEKVVVDGSRGLEMVDLSESQDIKDLLAQGWEREDDMAELAGVEDDGGPKLAFRGLYLATDNNLTQNPRNEITFGKWSYNDAKKTITLNDKHGSGTYKIRAIAPDELQLVGAEGDGDGVVKYTSFAMRTRLKEDDPFYIANNRWRIKPLKPETDEAIYKRLTECIRFFVLFYKDMVAKDAQTVSFYGLPCCLKFYGPGIFIQKKTELQSDWIQCFYNKDQAMKAYTMMDKVIGKKYTWPKGSMNWVKKNADVLEQMYDNIIADSSKLLRIVKAESL